MVYNNNWLLFLSGLRYHVVLLDVDSKDTSTGMSSPPLAFTTHKFLEATKSILNSDGNYNTLLHWLSPSKVWYNY